MAERETHIQTMLVDLDAAATAIAAAEASMEGKVAELVVAKAAKSESETTLREEIAALETTLTAQVCLSVSNSIPADVPTFKSQSICFVRCARLFLFEFYLKRACVYNPSQ